MITVSDVYPLKHESHEGIVWVDMKAEIVPSTGSRLKRWWVEICINWSDQLNPPLAEGEFAPSYHYYQFDYSTYTLRGAMNKAWSAFEKAQDYMKADPKNWPWPEKW